MRSQSLDKYSDLQNKIRSMSGNNTQLNANELAQLAKGNGDVGLISLRGRFSYASARYLSESVQKMGSPYKVIIYDFGRTEHLDTSAAVAIAELVSEAIRTGKTCFLTGMPGNAEVVLESLGALDEIPPDQIVPNRLDAIRYAVAFMSE